MSKPETYWEKRCALMEEAVERLATVVLNASPMSRPLLQDWLDEWSRIRRELHEEDERAALAQKGGK